MSKEINIAKNLVFLRKSHHWTIEEVADKVNVSRQAIAKWESGNSIPDLANCAELADLYNVSVDDLIFSSGEKATNLPPKRKAGLWDCDGSKRWHYQITCCRPRILPIYRRHQISFAW